MQPAAIASYAAAFASVPYASVAIDNFLRPEKFAALQRVFSIESHFEERYTLWGLVDGRPRGDEEPVSAEVWHAASEERRAYVARRFAGAKPDYRMGQGTVTRLKFKELLGGSEFMSFLEGATGIRPATLSGMQIRIMSRGQYQGAHSDSRSDRVLCAVFYASTTWHPTFGGRFRHLGPGSLIAPIEPWPNRLLLFQPRTGCKHDVEPITDSQWERWAYTLWFGTPLAEKPQPGSAPVQSQ